MTDNYGNASQPPQQPPNSGNPPPPPPPPGGGYPGPQGPGGYQPPPAGGYGQQPGAPAWTQGYPAQQPDNFFKVLFDFSFSRFITLSFAKFLFILYIVFVALAYLILVAVSLFDNFAWGLLVAVIGAPIALLYVIGLRMGLEFLVAQIRTAENTSIMAQRQS